MYPYYASNPYNENFHSETLDQERFHTPCSSSSFLFPSPIYNIPLEDEAVFCEFFQQQAFFADDHTHSILAHETTHDNLESAWGECSTTEDGQKASILVKEPENDSTPKKTRPCGDRHSKIKTARGFRDRRMRLSFDVAKRLFGLQDVLGFDKASETIDWLLTESKTAILELYSDRSCTFMGVSNSSTSSTTSECEVASGSVDHVTAKSKAKCSSGSCKKQKDKIIRVRKCADLHHPLAKETRVRARQRARERTIEKKKNCNNFWCKENQLQSSNCFQLKQVFVADNSSLMTGNCSSSHLLG